MAHAGPGCEAEKFPPCWRRSYCLGLCNGGSSDCQLPQLWLWAEHRGCSKESLKTRFLPLNWAQSTHPQKQASAGLVLLGTLGKWWVRWQPQITFRPPTSMMQSQGEEGDD